MILEVQPTLGMWSIAKSFVYHFIFHMSRLQTVNPVKRLLNWTAEHVKFNSYCNLHCWFFSCSHVQTSQLCSYFVRATIIHSGDHGRVAELYCCCGFSNSCSHGDYKFERTQVTILNSFILLETKSCATELKPSNPV